VVPDEKPAQGTPPKTDDKPAATPSELEIGERHGKKVTVPLDKAKDLALKGLDHEVRQQDIQRRETQLRADEPRYRAYGELRDWVDRDPVNRAALDLAMRNPQAVAALANAPKGAKAEDAETSGEVEGGAIRPQADSELRRELEAVKGQVREIHLKEVKGAQETRIKDEIAKYPWLSGRDSKLAFNQVVATLVTNPQEPVEAAVAGVASDFKEAEEDRQARALAKAEERKSLATLRPSQGAPLASPAEKLDRKSFGDGKLHTRVMEVAKHFGLGG
jgi:hypothetical protein